MNDIITVMVPVYNVEKYLEKCITSILNQSYKNIDVLLINDGSTDRSGEICDKYAKLDKRVRVIHKVNEGVSKTRNRGIDFAKGKYLVFVDSDDYLEIDYCKKLYEAQQQHENAFIMCGFKTVFASGEEDFFCFEKTERFSELSTKDIIELIEKWLLNSPCNKLYRVNELKKEKIRMPEDLSLAEDLLFNFEYLDKLVGDKIIVINEGLYNYRLQSSGTLNSKYYPEQLEIMKRVNERLYVLCNNVEVQNMERYYKIAILHLENAMKNNFKKDNYESYRRKLKKNNEIMKSSDYQNCLTKSGNSFSYIRRIICRIGNYLLLEVFFKICTILNPIKEFLYIYLKKPIINYIKKK